MTKLLPSRKAQLEAADDSMTEITASALTATDPLSLMKADPSDARFVG